jgi:flagellar motor protein MotB
MFQTLDHWMAGQTALMPAWLRPLQPQGTLQSPLALLQLDKLQYSQILGAESQQGMWQQDAAQGRQHQQQGQQPQHQQQQEHAEQGLPVQQQQQQHNGQSGEEISVPVAAVCMASTPSRVVNNIEWSEVSYDPAPGSTPATLASDSA